MMTIERPAVGKRPHHILDREAITEMGAPQCEFNMRQSLESLTNADLIRLTQQVIEGYREDRK